MTEQTLPIIAWFGLKMLSLIGIAVYVVFAGIIVRQESLMSHVLEEGFEPILRILTYIHFIAAIIVFLLALILL